MSVESQVTSDGDRADTIERSPGNSSLHHVAEVAQRLRAILLAADALTDKPDLNELDRIALDVLLLTGRDHADEVIRWIDKLVPGPEAAMAAHPAP